MLSRNGLICGGCWGSGGRKNEKGKECDVKGWNLFIFIRGNRCEFFIILKRWKFDFYWIMKSWEDKVWKLEI